ncbi:MAG TPA: hypothetical protein VF121_07010 [Thermoanaerobaculia bacterium]|nr:hypothetical protein [Thermoanaerobaculia bacterium]
MFLGHFAVGFAAKRAAPEVSLGTLFLAGQLADLLWPNFVLLGLERVEIEPGATAATPLDFVHYPYSHSLVALLGWGLALGGLWLALRRGRAAAALWIAALVVSHWVLDVVTHRPDVPVTIAGGEKLGLGLWSSVPGTIAVELLLFLAGLALYARATAARDRTGRLALWALAAFLLVVYLANLFAPPPPSPAAIAWAAQAMWLLVAWGFWVDRHREPAAPR